MNPHRVLHQKAHPKSTRHVDKEIIAGNRCNSCKVADVTTCPLQEAAYEKHGWYGLKECAMGDAIEKMLRAAREDGRFLNSKDGKRTA